MEEKRYYVGVDLGQRRDYTAIAVLERVVERVYGRDFIRLRRVEEGVRWHYRLRYLRRLGLGCGYESAVESVRRVILGAEMGGRYEVVADATGVGAGVVEMLRRACGAVTAVVITSGSSAHVSDGNWLTPKKDLIGELAVMLEQRVLRVAPGMQELGQLERELLGMRMGRGGREHDDMVMAVALACWRARRRGVIGEQGRSLGLG
ncbi:MAG: hypothetical protein JJE04_10775 [Acidobacteriia bacterium]|nr:hypothetical protein [Terriglobia bacterium]